VNVAALTRSKCSVTSNVLGTPSARSAVVS
jgi:hypothetical protein